VRKKIDTRLLPPLSSLKGFEAAVRRQSIRGAAEELNLTHSAISHQIEALEQSLGVALFSRVGRNIASTEEGRMFYPFVRSALESLVDGVDNVRRVQADKTLRVQTYVTASLRWLAGRIPRFLAAHPGIKLVLSTCVIEYAYDDLHSDVGLVFIETPPDPARFHWVPLFAYEMVAVCSPELARRLPPGAGPAELQALPLLGVYTDEHNWDEWFAAAGVEHDPGRACVLVDTLALAIDIARAGGGVALVNGPFMDEDFAGGRLVRAVDHKLVIPGAWGLICRNELRKDRRVRAFIDWLTRDAGA
jgi:LysR family glycine cleavage system transcriptional activator